MEHQRITALLEKEVVPALGCTAPVAVALAAARSAAESSEPIQCIKLSLSTGMYKNGWGVAVPGTVDKGNALGAALGALGGDYHLGLEVLNSATAEHMQLAKSMVANGLVEVHCDRTKSGVYIQAEVQTSSDNISTIIMGGHSNIVEVVKNGKIIFSSDNTKDGHTTEFTGSFTLEEIVDYAQTVAANEIAFLLDGETMNYKLAEDGLINQYGLGSGKALYEAYANKDLTAYPAIYAKILTCAASDARMGGSMLPAMSTVGSGNQGITAILPVAVYANSIAASAEQKSRALAISHLVTYMVKTYVGRISSTCLCSIASASGVAAAIVWLSGGTIQQMSYAITNVVSALAGQICDGAKCACALKMGVAADQAFTAAELALKGCVAGFYDGLATDSMEETLKNLNKLTLRTRQNIDDTVVDILEEKTYRMTGH